MGLLPSKCAPLYLGVSPIEYRETGFQINMLHRLTLRFPPKSIQYGTFLQLLPDSRIQHENSITNIFLCIHVVTQSIFRMHLTVIMRLSLHSEIWFSLSDLPFCMVFFLKNAYTHIIIELKLYGYWIIRVFFHPFRILGGKGWTLIWDYLFLGHENAERSALF